MPDAGFHTVISDVYPTLSLAFRVDDAFLLGK